MIAKVSQPVAQHKVSFCITCKGRRDHLQETLPRNLKNNQDYPNAEFVILDYDSKDGLGEWLKENYRKELDSGRILYAQYNPAPFFKMAHAKNMSHRLATGDILCNLDADNVTARGFATWLNEQFVAEPNALIRPPGNSVIRKMAGSPKAPSGSRGRIAMSSENFYALRGYDEIYEGHGNEDNDLMRRALAMNLKRIDVPENMFGDAIEHPNERRVEMMTPERQKEFFAKVNSSVEGSRIPMAKLGRKLTERLNAVGRHANTEGRWGAIEEGAMLSDINGQDIILEPYPHVPARAPQGILFRTK